MFIGGVSIFLFSAYVFLLMIYARGWRIAGRQLPAVSEANRLVKLTVIVPARNETATIENCLESLLAQDYPVDLYEIIVVNDGSDDDTAEKVAGKALADSRVKLINLRPSQGSTAYKKRAIEAGISAANGELILCTDADCTHHSEWASRMAAAYENGKYKFIAAPVVYQTRPTLLSVFQTLDFMTLQGITAASVATRFHTMCNGANIAYAREAFYAVRGFEGIDQLPTGDDMLLMYKIFKHYPDSTRYLLLPEVIVATDAAAGWGAFFQQRIRWASKAAYYDDKRIFWVLFLVYFFNAWLAALAVMAFWWAVAAWWLLGLFLAKAIAELGFIWPVASFFGKKKWLPWFPILQPLHVLYTIAAGWLGKFGSYTWKGRVIKSGK